MKEKQNEATPVVLVINDSSGKGREHKLEGESVIIGSGAAAGLKVTGTGISSIHAMIKRAGEKVSVFDLGSEGGTFLDGNKVREAELKSGSRLKLGDAEIVMRIGAEKPAAQPAAPAKPPAVPEKPKEKAGKAATAEKAEKKPASAVATADQKPLGRVLAEDLPKEDRPSADGRILEVAVLWQGVPLDIAHFKEGTVTAGEDKGNSFYINAEGFPEPRFPVVKMEGGDFVATVAEGMNLNVKRGGKIVTMDELAKTGELGAAAAPYKASTFKIGLADTAILDVGTIEFRMRYAAPTPPVLLGLGEAVDFSSSKYFSMSFFGHLLLLIALVYTPLDLQIFSEDLFKQESRYAKLLLSPEKVETKKKFDFSKGKAPDEEGKFGKRRDTKIDTSPSMKGAPQVDANKREEDRKIALNSGILGIMGKSMASASNIFGPGGLGTGINEALGGIEGTELGDAGGVGGLGTRGFGPGGGGGSLGIGGIGGWGRRGGGGGSGMGIDLSARGKKMTRISAGQTVVKGGLSKEEIGRVIRRHLAQIKYCYEKELTKNPNLEGKVAVWFEIGASGAVTEASVKETTMNNAEVESCILKVMKNLRFPQPKGGGVVEVTYPFIMTPGGG